MKSKVVLSPGDAGEAQLPGCDREMQSPLTVAGSVCVCETFVRLDAFCPPVTDLSAGPNVSLLVSVAHVHPV